MNKFFKYGLMTAGVAMAVGIVFALFSTIIGGRIAWNNHSGWIFRSFGNMLAWDDDWDFWDEYHYGNDGFRVAGNRNHTSSELRINGELANMDDMAKPGEIAADGVRNLDLDLGAGQFFIREKDTDDGIISILVQGKTGDCDYYTEKDTLHVESFKGNHHIGDDLSRNQIVIEFPKGKVFHEVELTCGAAMVEAVGLNVNELEVEVGAGEAVIASANADKFSADIGAGSVEASSISAREVDLKVGMGECVYHGTIFGDLNAECDLGNMEIAVTGNREDYNYEIECSAGNIDLGGKSITALAAEKEIYNGAPGTFELSCNIGNITVDFLD